MYKVGTHLDSFVCNSPFFLASFIEEKSFSHHVLFLINILFVNYLFLVAAHRLYSSCVERGLLFVFVVCRLLDGVASLIVKHRL